MEGKRQHLIKYYTGNLENAIKKVEFYELKSNSKSKVRELNYWRGMVELFNDTIEVLGQ